VTDSPTLRDPGVQRGLERASWRREGIPGGRQSVDTLPDDVLLLILNRDQRSHRRARGEQGHPQLPDSLPWVRENFSEHFPEPPHGGAAMIPERSTV
jgi:hypothetical protein